jgi:diadenosine tetraphosphate (Ap4A) HIT family hydrolase
MTPCPLCLPRPDDAPQWIKVSKLSVSTLYLDRNQTYRGHCQLVYDTSHVVGLENLPTAEYNLLMSDLHRAATAISSACQPNLMNYVSLGNVVPHLHWHLVPRYESDPRWGRPIYTSDPSDMPVTTISEAEYRQLVKDLNLQLERRVAQQPHAASGSA